MQLHCSVCLDPKHYAYAMAYSCQHAAPVQILRAIPAFTHLQIEWLSYNIMSELSLC